MAYIGRTPLVGKYAKMDDFSASFNGSLTSFSLTVAGDAYNASSASQMIVSVGGVLQQPETAYTVAGTSITFTSPPASGADFFAVALGDTLDIGVPSNGTVTAAKLGTGAIIGTNIQAYDVDTLKADVADNLTAGFSTTVYDAGTKASGTYTPDQDNSNMQKAVNGGAHTLAPTTDDCAVVIQYTNNASAGTITTSGFTLVDGDTISTTNGDDFFFYLTKANGFSLLTVKALQ